MGQHGSEAYACMYDACAGRFEQQLACLCLQSVLTVCVYSNYPVTRLLPLAPFFLTRTRKPVPILALTPQEFPHNSTAACLAKHKAASGTKRAAARNKIFHGKGKWFC